MDPVESRHLAEALKVFATGRAGSVLQEMADEVLSGRLSLSAAAGVDAYSEAMISTSRPFSEKWHSLSDIERNELAEQGFAELKEESVDAAHRTRSDERGSARGTGGRMSHDGRSWSLY
ncbi:hypothetical protein NGM37_60455 [Streptomyces sp. TRM76130]|nr:hypothetical protein [Streptomyces sp. TRM76130]